MAFSLRPLLATLCFLTACGRYSKIDTSWWAEPRQHLRIYNRELAAEYGLSSLGTACSILLEETVPFTHTADGEPIKADPDHSIWVLNLISSKKMRLEEAKPFAQSLAQSFWDKVQNDPVFTRYVEVDSSKFRHSPKKLYPTSIGFKLAFWDENTERYTSPYLAQIRLVDGYLMYFYADGKQGPLTTPIVEPLFPRELDENEIYLRKRSTCATASS